MARKWQLSGRLQKFVLSGRVCKKIVYWPWLRKRAPKIACLTDSVLPRPSISSILQLTFFLCHFQNQFFSLNSRTFANFEWKKATSIILLSFSIEFNSIKVFCVIYLPFCILPRISKFEKSNLWCQAFMLIMNLIY